MSTTHVISRCMSTQHPDNAHWPFFSNNPQISGEEEVREAHYVYSTLGVQEQMWDHEGKEVDSHVVTKLLSDYPSFFRKKVLGKNVFLTLRVPNPERERASAKILLEILESIPRSYDTARHFYKDGVAPIFEIILPMTTNALELNRIWNYYRFHVAGKADRPVLPGDVTLGEWIGDFHPASINVIPLIEDKPSLLSADTIVEEYLKGKEQPYQRVFLARSDPAMAYGSASAVLLIKIALARLHKLEQKLGIPLYPIVGVGSAPFRGNFKPTNVKSRLKGYPSVQTFTVQSAFKFDYPEELVRKAVAFINKSTRRAPIPVDDEQPLLDVIENISATFSRQVERLTPLINGVAKYVPPRRKRKLHTGLFGYTRAVAGKRLPRAISFCAALYSIGLPPEFLGLANLKASHVKTISEIYPNFIEDLRESGMYFDPQCLSMLPIRVADDIRRTVRLLKLDVKPELIHQALVGALRGQLNKSDTRGIPDLITQAAKVRRFLG
jgi:phosphoenolpyruvate carboxylase